MLDVKPPLKRSPSPIPPPQTPSPPPKKSKSINGTPKTPKSRSEPKKTSSVSTTSSPSSNGSWSAEKKGLFMDEIIAAGYKSADLVSIASKLGMSKRQLVDQLVPNRGGNMRGKAVKAVSTDN